MNFLLQYKAWLIGGGVAIALLLLANKFENAGIRQEERGKWETAIREAKPDTVLKEVIKIEQVPILGTAKSDRVFVQPLVPDSVIDSLDYYNWLLTPYSVEVKDTSGAELKMTATPRESAISYVLKPVPKIREIVHITDKVLEPPIEKNWIIGVDMGYHEEARLGGLLGIKPVILGVDYYPEAEKKWGGHIQFQFEF